MEYTVLVWEIEYTEEFENWWNGLSEAEQDAVAFSVGLLGDRGPSLGYPHSSSVGQSRHKKMRELRSQSGGKPVRTFYIFDPSRTAILLVGGDKTGNDRFYDVMIPKADKIYDDYLKELKEEKDENP
ncbi:MAG: type II toxin-antitoxin system RelE/ParE family toxin [Spirochaetales bacterium]|jgi:hypothetical protein|nr:type II toxin-antitoxin system RelE/ParE family toxin [Spirochaetales bacterium]